MYTGNLFNTVYSFFIIFLSKFLFFSSCNYSVSIYLFTFFVCNSPLKIRNIYIYIFSLSQSGLYSPMPFTSTNCKVLHQHLLFTPDFLFRFIFHHSISFPRSGKNFNDLSYARMLKAIKKRNSKMCLFSLIGKKWSNIF